MTADGIRSVLYDALHERRDVRALVAELAAIETPNVHVLADGCGGDSEGLKALLAQPHVVLSERCSHEDWGHHSCNVVVLLGDGRIVHAECGGCSCGGSGSWSFAETLEDAERLIPEQER